MTDSSQAELDVWKGDWGLPSIDTNSLMVLAYAKFNGIHLTVKETSNPFKTPKGQLPVLRLDNTIEDSPQNIIKLLKAKRTSTDTLLTAKQLSDILAYEALLKEKLYPSLQYVWWVEPRNLAEFTRPWYFKAMPFLLNIYYNRRFEQCANNLLESLHPTEEDSTAMETKIYSDAQKCITLLSSKLGQSEFFFGSTPTSLDAILYAYLAPFLKAPLRSTALQNHLKACTNLTRFISRISQRYFADEHQAYEKVKTEESAQSANAAKDGFPNKVRNQILAAVFATLTMLGYGFSNGILKVPGRKSEKVNGESDEYTEDVYEIDYDDFYG